MAAPSSPAARSSRFPLWAKIFLGLFVVLILIALALPYFINVDRYRDTIAEAIAKQTGRKVTLGPIHARLFPGAGVTVADLHIGNPTGFPVGDLLSADEIGVNVALAPLLHGIIHVNSVDVVRPKLTVLSESNGKNNYTFTAAEPAAPPKSGESSSVTLDQIDSINLTGAEIVVGSVIKGAAAPLADTKGISVTLHNFAVSPMRMHDWQAESNLSSVTLALSGWKDPIAFRTGKFTLSGGKLDAQFVADLATAADVKGTVNVPDFEHPQVNLEMSSSQLDVDKLLEVAGSGPGIPSSPTAAAPAPESPAAAGKPPAKGKQAAGSVPKAAPAPAAAPAGKSELVAHGHINIEKITSKPYTVGPANVEIRVYTDRAELWPISIGMYGGTLQISSRVDRVTDPARFTANIQLRNLDVAKVLDVSPAARGKMGGTGELDLPQLGGSLSEAWKKTLTGTGKFAVRNGHLPGVNLAGAVQSVAKMAGVGGDTPFSILEGDLAIADQRVASKQIHLDSSAGIVDLRGSLGLDSTLDYQGTVTVNPAAVAGSGAVGGIVGGLIGSRVGKITVPFSLTGTIESPKVAPGKGIPNFGAPSTASGAAPAGAPSAQPTVQDDVNALKNLFKKKN